MVVPTLSKSCLLGKGRSSASPAPGAHDPEAERSPVRRSRRLTSDAWQARVLEVGGAHGNMPGGAEGSILPTGEVIFGPDQLARVEPIGT